MKGLNSLFRMKADRLFCSFKVLVSGFCCLAAHAQDCPKNIDFETNTFQGWTCYVGYVVEQNNENSIRLSPTTQPGFNRHTLYPNTANDLDPWGHFPITCPNGGGYSVKLGNETGGALAEGLYYEFTIPLNQDLFTLVYHYAIVFQEPPHLEHQQPRFEVEVRNVTTNEPLGCASFEFRPFLPLTEGFDTTYDLINNVRVWYKNWTPISVNLDGHAGQTFGLFFRTADCTYFDHFAYAYVDVTTECNGEFTAAKFCPDDTLIHLTAVSGYQNYIWHNNTFTQVLGTNQSISVPPQMVSGGSLPVEVFPYHGYGCIDTLYAIIGDSLVIAANAGADVISCNSNPVSVGGPAIQGLAYNWTPPEGLSDAAVSNPLASPESPTNYILNVRSAGGGCATQDTVFVGTSVINDSLEISGSANYCIGFGDSPTLRVESIDSIQWFRNDLLIIGADRPELEPTESGQYYAVLFNSDDCRVATASKTINIDFPREAISYPVVYTVANAPTNLNARNFGETVRWTPSLYLNDPTIVTPVFTGNADQSYTIEIITASGCVTVDTVNVKIIEHASIYVPGAFTPNNDGLNDVLRPMLMGIKELHYFKVFNRWGQLIFQTKSPGVGWDGRVKGTIAPTQVVVWMAAGVGWDNKLYTTKGTTTLVK